mgnify:CR=1 FL=1
MDIEEARFGDAVVLRPKERIDQTSADDFQSHLLNAIESGATALRALMIAAKKGKAGDVALGVSDLQPNVNEIFEISRFNFVVTVHATLRDGVAAASDEALAAFEAG